MKQWGVDVRAPVQPLVVWASWTRRDTVRGPRDGLSLRCRVWRPMRGVVHAPLRRVDVCRARGDTPGRAK